MSPEPRRQFVPLEKWAEELYGEHAPSIYTLRRWARDGKIFPVPRKHGRAYFVERGASYIDDYNDLDLVRRIRGMK